MPFNKHVLLSFVFSIIAFCASSQNFDIDLLRSINHNESDFKNQFFKNVSNSVIVFNIAAPAGVLTAGIIKHDKQLKKDAAYMIGGIIVNSIVTTGMKKIIQRDRPFITYPDIIKREEADGYSFPSGHTSAAFCTATSLSLLFPKWYVIVPSYLYAATVGYSRMYLGMHYPTDVFAGALVGAGSAWLSFKAEKWISKKQNANKTISPAPAL